MIYTLVKNLFKILFTIFLRLKVEGRENIPKEGPLYGQGRAVCAGSGHYL